MGAKQWAARGAGQAKGPQRESAVGLEHVDEDAVDELTLDGGVTTGGARRQLGGQAGRAQRADAAGLESGVNVDHRLDGSMDALVVGRKSSSGAVLAVRRLDAVTPIAADDDAGALAGLDSLNPVPSTRRRRLKASRSLEGLAHLQQPPPDIDVGTGVLRISGATNARAARRAARRGMWRNGDEGSNSKQSPPPSAAASAGQDGDDAAASPTQVVPVGAVARGRRTRGNVRRSPTNKGSLAAGVGVEVEAEGAASRSAVGQLVRSADEEEPRDNGGTTLADDAGATEPSQIMRTQQTRRRRARLRTGTAGALGATADGVATVPVKSEVPGVVLGKADKGAEDDQTTPSAASAGAITDEEASAEPLTVGVRRGARRRRRTAATVGAVLAVARRQPAAAGSLDSGSAHGAGDSGVGADDVTML